MHKLKRKWRRLAWYEKIAYIVGVPATVMLIVLGILFLFRVQYTSLYKFGAMTIALMLSQTVLHLRKERKRALICLGTAVFTAAACAIAYFT